MLHPFEDSIAFPLPNAPKRDQQHCFPHFQPPLIKNNLADMLEYLTLEEMNPQNDKNKGKKILTTEIQLTYDGGE